MANATNGGAQWPIPAAAIDQTRLPLRGYLIDHGNGFYGVDLIGPDDAILVNDGNGFLGIATSGISVGRISKAADRSFFTIYS